MTQVKFWMVWGENTRPPVFRHATYDAAEREAERLARTHGGRFFVLEAVAAVERNDVTWTRFPVDDIPF